MVATSSADPEGSLGAATQPPAVATLGCTARWAGRGLVAVLDQALFAGTNFVVSVYLARHLDAASYGAFALAQAAFWLVGALYTAVLTEPMVVFGAGKGRGHFSSYLAALIEAHTLVSLPVAGATALIGLACVRLLPPPVGEALLGLAVATPFILLAWFGRAANYARMRPAGSIVGSALYCAVVLAGLVFLQVAGRLTPGSAFLALSAGGAVAGLVTLIGLRPRWREDRIPLRSLAAQHWAYGRWAVATAAVAWVPLNVYYLALPRWAGLGAGAGLKAVMNFAQPALHTLIALSGLLLPLLVQRQRSGGRAAVTAAAWRFLAVFGAMTGCYLAVLWLTRGQLFDLLYAGKYREYVPLVLWVGLVPVAASGMVVLGSMLRALERPDHVFRANAAAAAVTLTAGLGLAAWQGVGGAVAAIIFAYLVTGASMYHLWRAGDSVEPGATR